MSSKVLRAAEVEGAMPMAWLPAPSGAEPEVTPPPAPPPVPAAPPIDYSAELARRVAEVEVQAGRQAREARQAGRQEGEAAGRKAAEEELRPVIERLIRSIDDIARLRPQLVSQAEASLLKLSVAIARRVLHREISLDPDALAGIVRAALDKVQLDEVCRVRAHPEQADMLRAAFEKASRAILVAPDASLERGGVVVETGRGKLDASVDTQLAEIERGLTDRLRRHA